MELDLNKLLSVLSELGMKIKLLDQYNNDTRTGCDLLNKSLLGLMDLLNERTKNHEKGRQLIEKQKEVVEELSNLKKRLEKIKAQVPKSKLMQIRAELEEDEEVQEDENLHSIQEPSNALEDMSLLSPINCCSAIEYTSPVTVPGFSGTTRIPMLMATPKARNDVEISISYVSNDELKSLPDYMRGRLRLTDVNSLVDIFNETLTKKYELLSKQKKSLKVKSELDKFVTWKQQIDSNTKDLYFCTADDIFSECGVKLGKKELSLIIILRHLKRIREMRDKKKIFYIACF